MCKNLKAAKITRPIVTYGLGDYCIRGKLAIDMGKKNIEEDLWSCEPGRDLRVRRNAEL